MQVSVTVITKNEAALLRKMLQSVRWAKEIIVVDSGSDDGTREIAAEFTDRVIQHDFADFASQKNFAQSQASSDWILNLDADEVCTPELAEEIQALSEDQHDGFLLRRDNYFQGRMINHCGWSPDYKLRLYRRSKGLWKGKVHETVALENPSSTRKLNHRLEHFTYRGFDRYIESVHRYSNLAAEQMAEQGRSAGILDLMVRPPVAFLKKYFFQLGLLDAGPGFVISTLTAYGVFCRYALLREKSSGRKPIAMVTSHDENRSR